MFLALRELSFARGRFALMASVIALVAVLTVLLSGLANGLVDDGISGLRALPVTHLGFQKGADSTFSRSAIDARQVEAAGSAAGTEAEPLGLKLAHATADRGANVDLALIGLAPGGFVAESVFGASGPPPPGGVVISQGLADEGIAVGDVLQVDRTNVHLAVTGIAPEATYGHVDAVYVSLPDWQAVAHTGSGGTGDATASAVAIRTDDAAALEAATADADLDIVTKTAAYAGSPGYSAETSTMSLIRGFLYLISATILGSFFTIWTIQRRSEIGLQKALGASTGAVVRHAFGEVLIVLIAATATGSLVGAGLGLLVDGGAVPFALTPGTALGASLVLIVSGALGMLVGIRKIVTVDPIIALGAAS